MVEYNTINYLMPEGENRSPVPMPDNENGSPVRDILYFITHENPLWTVRKISIFTGLTLKSILEGLARYQTIKKTNASDPATRLTTIGKVIEERRKLQILKWESQGWTQRTRPSKQK